MPRSNWESHAREEQRDATRSLSENELTRFSVVTSVVYTKGRIEYATFDAPIEIRFAGSEGGEAVVQAIEVVPVLKRD